MASKISNATRGIVPTTERVSIGHDDDGAPITLQVSESEALAFRALTDVALSDTRDALADALGDVLDSLGDALDSTDDTGEWIIPTDPRVIVTGDKINLTDDGARHLQVLIRRVVFGTHDGITSGRFVAGLAAKGIRVTDTLCDEALCDAYVYAVGRLAGNVSETFGTFLATLPDDTARVSVILASAARDGVRVITSEGKGRDSRVKRHSVNVESLDALVSTPEGADAYVDALDAHVWDDDTTALLARDARGRFLCADALALMLAGNVSGALKATGKAYSGKAARLFMARVMRQCESVGISVTLSDHDTATLDALTRTIDTAHGMALAGQGEPHAHGVMVDGRNGRPRISRPSDRLTLSGRISDNGTRCKCAGCYVTGRNV